MALFRTRKPDVKALARRGDADALVAASGYQDLVAGSGGVMIDRGAAVRREAILALGGLGPESGSEAVYAALADPTDEVQLAAIRVLQARRDARGLAAGLGWLPAERGPARGLAIAVLAELRRPDTAPLIARVLTHAPNDAPVDDETVALLTLLLSADGGSGIEREVIAELLGALADERGAIADRAEELLALLAPVSTEGVHAELSSGTVPHRAAAVISRTKDPCALEPLLEGLLHADPRVRAECARALGELRDPAAIEALIEASDDLEHRVAAQADWALDRLGTVALMVRLSMVILDAIAAGSCRALPSAGNGSYDDAGAQRGSPLAAMSPEALACRLVEMEDLGRATAGPF
jgi:HEAT repeat protein